ncbi:hypothetical protein EPN52_00175 [bacterium]|nr:MAG: hypothetical protein EPN52_00175 [bacterium]
MIKFSKYALSMGAALATLALAAPSFGATAHARFSDVPASNAAHASSFTGAPDLPLTLALVEAGNGPKAFKSGTLVGVLGGDQTKAEVAKLTKQFGSSNVQSFLTVFDFAVDDSLKIVTAKHVALPAQPEPAPTDGKALAVALFKGGELPSGSFNVEYLFDRLLTHPIHVEVMDDVDAKYGPKADANFHVILQQAMVDLGALYHGGAAAAAK